MPQLLEIWLKASSRKPMFMPSTMGRRPVMAAPTPAGVGPTADNLQKNVMARIDFVDWQEQGRRM